MSAQVDDKDFSSHSKWLCTHHTRPYMMLEGAFCEAAWRALSTWHHVHHGCCSCGFFPSFLKQKNHELGRGRFAGEKSTEELKRIFFFPQCPCLQCRANLCLNVANDGPQTPVLHLSLHLRCFYSNCFLSESPGSEASCMVRPSLSSVPSRTRLGAPALL